jgi:hypothetical protein
VITGVLRLGMHIGIDFAPPSDLDTLSAGLEAVIFADIAQFTTNITASPNSDDCQISAEEVSIFARTITASFFKEFVN